MSARTIARRLSSVSGLYAYLIARGDPPVRTNPVPRGLSTRRPGNRRTRQVPLVRVPRTLPRILARWARWTGLSRRCAPRGTGRWSLAMVLVGLRRCEVLGLRFGDVQVADRRLVIVAGKGGHHRVVPAANSFFDALGCVSARRAAGERGHGSGVRGAEGPAPREAAVRGGAGRDPRWCAPPVRAGARHLSPVAAHLDTPYPWTVINQLSLGPFALTCCGRHVGNHECVRSGAIMRAFGVDGTVSGRDLPRQRACVVIDAADAHRCVYRLSDQVVPIMAGRYPAVYFDHFEWARGSIGGLSTTVRDRPSRRQQ